MIHRIVVTSVPDLPQWDTYHGPWERPDIQVVRTLDQFWQRSEAERIRHLQGASACVVGGEPYTEHVIAACPGLKIIARAGVGFDLIDLEAASRHGVWVTNTPGALEQAVAEMTWMMILSLARKLEAHIRLMRTGKWEWQFGTELYGKSLGIIGVGRIGKQVARIAQGFGMPLLGFDLVQDPAFAASVGLRYVELRELLASSDVVTIHTPRLPETVGLMNAEKLGWMKPSAFLINTARGGIVDERALLTALREGRLAGAGLDVFEHEPLPADHPLRKAPNVILTPHIATATFDTRRRMYGQAMDNILAVLDGKRPPNPVNIVQN